MEQLEIISPEGAPATKRHSLAPRLATLREARVGIAENGKPGSLPIIEALAKFLRDEQGTGDVLIRHKRSPGKPNEFFAELEEICGAAICGVGD